MGIKSPKDLRMQISKDLQVQSKEGIHMQQSASCIYALIS